MSEAGRTAVRYIIEYQQDGQWADTGLVPFATRDQAAATIDNRFIRYEGAQTPYRIVQVTTTETREVVK